MSHLYVILTTAAYLLSLGLYITFLNSGKENDVGRVTSPSTLSRQSANRPASSRLNSSFKGGPISFANGGFEI